MNKDTFKKRMISAASETIEFTRTIVLEELPNKYKFLASLNCSYDKNHDEGPHLKKYPEDNGKRIGPTDSDEIVSLLYRDGKVPVWIDCSVVSVEEETSIVKLVCSGRYTDKDDWLYHKNLDNPPFHPLGPPIPPWLRSFVDENGKHVERNEKFSLYWKKHYKVPLKTIISYRFYLYRDVIWRFLWKKGFIKTFYGMTREEADLIKKKNSETLDSISSKNKIEGD